MKPRPGRIAMTNRGKVVPKPQVSAPLTFPAPVGGLITNHDETIDVPGACSILLNCFPTLTGARVRGGSAKYGLTDDLGDVVSMLAYRYGGTQKMFAATAGGIFEMTSPATPPATVTADVSGLNGGDWSYAQFTNTGGSYMIAANGSDAVRSYDGSSFSTPSITFSDSTTANQLNYVWPFKNQLFFLKNNSMDMYYLSSQAISGGASLFPIGGVVKRGGRLLTGFTWSVDSGDGMDDKCCFLTSEGEVAVYSGTDPSNANTFGIEQIYQVGKPLGKGAVLRNGGDALIATMDGLISLKRVAAEGVQNASVSRAIEEEWRRAAAAAPYGWKITAWPERNLAFVTFPENVVVNGLCFVFHTLTLRWAIIGNWRPTCFETLQGGLFFGAADGYVRQAEISGTDDGLTFAAVYLSQFRPVSTTGQRKSATLASMLLRGTSAPNVRLFARADGDAALPTYSTVTTGNSTSSEWDVGLWDEAIWDGVSGFSNYRFRQGVRAAGSSLALGGIIVSGGAYALNVEFRHGALQMTEGEASA